MKLFLVRHGESVSAETDPRLPLSLRGRKETEQIAHLLSPFPIKRVLHSPKLRAKQTAEILATGQLLEEHPGITPMDSIDPIRVELENSGDDLMIVSHLPFLERMLSTLLFGEEKEGWFEFCTSAVVCLKREKRWRLLWIVTPETLSLRRST